MDGSNGLTCVTCRVVFENPELQREHYKSEWHRYNLKRLTADLSAIPLELFTEKVANFQNSTTQKSTVPQVPASTLYCKPCKKQIKSENAMTDHLASKKHKEMVKSLENGEKKGPKQPRKKVEKVEVELKEAEAATEEEEDSDSDSSGWETDEDQDQEDLELNEEEALPVTSCLFCPQTKNKLEEIREHMRFHHGFVLPDEKYLIDEQGCLEYLGLKVGAGRCCIYCPDRKARFANVESCQKHMRDKEHCKLRRDPNSMIELDDFYDYSSMYENDEMNDQIIDDGWSLTLPSGATLGHRHLFRYFKQYLRPVDGTQRILSKAALEKARGIYPQLAWTGTTGGGVIQARKVARDMKFVERFRRRFDLRVACKSNKLFKTRGFVGDNH
ncbi:unnamed protein product [Caenorhabditis angaria]|uniref:C2H2-type domain-containing protein n=1 Tax=Caenorhabditis angaria TaxID=860376 RepID=A0A9P1IFZ0_9PELO|nr:unnamed protein product [Caenorhabditis angaria]